MESMNEKDILAYKIGGLLYTPALNTKIADKIIQKKYDCLTSIAFCLEDSIKDEALPMAEIELCNTLSKLKEIYSELPLLFVRVRTPEHMKKIHKMIKGQEDIITGYILPKFDLTNCDEYLNLIEEYNINSNKKLYIMPILESSMVADIGGRVPALYELKEKLLRIKEYVLNIRVGGNDFSNMYELRRNINQNIYEIGVIRDILVNIINVFGTDFVVSVPVWKYFGSDVNEEWKHGLIRELELDKLNGFIIGTSTNSSAIYKMTCDEWYSEEKDVSVNDYVDFCIEFCKEHNVNIFAPRRFLSEIIANKNRFDAIGVKLFANTNAELVKMLDDKQYTYEYFKTKLPEIVPETRVAHSLDEFCLHYNELSKIATRVCYKLIEDEGARSFRVIDNSIESLNGLLNKPGMKVRKDSSISFFEQEWNKLTQLPSQKFQKGYKSSYCKHIQKNHLLCR